MNRIVTGSTVFILFLAGAKLFPIGDQLSSERFLEENRYFIHFADVATTNFGKDKEKGLFKEAGQYDFWAQVAFLQSKYKRTYKEIRKSQDVLVKLYVGTVDNYIIDTKKILDRIAPTIIRSRDDRAKLYLSLGYRDVTEAKGQQIVGMHSNHRLFSYKIKRYIEGIKLCRRAKRYAILAILQARTPREEKRGLENLTYEEIGVKINALQQKGDPLVLPEYKLLLHHIDNNQKTAVKETLYQQYTKQYRVKGLSGALTADERADIQLNEGVNP